MLQSSEIYLVSVTLNDGHAMNCTLLSPPTPEVLAAVATAEGQPADFAKVLAVAGEIEVPAIRERASATEISIANVNLGTIKVETAPAYQVGKKRGRKPRQASNQTSDQASDNTADSDAPLAATGKKRGRRPKPTDQSTDQPADSPPVDTPPASDSE